MASTLETTTTSDRPTIKQPRRRRSLRSGEARYGWLFVSPMIVVLGLFLIIPIGLALWVSLLNYNGQGSPFGANAHFVGLDNYRRLFLQDGLTRTDFMTSLRNTFYFVLFVVPLQTILALSLALVVHQRFLRGRSFFRSAFYFPSVTSSIAISIVFLFLFQNTGVINSLLAKVGVDGPAWFSDPRGLFHIAAENLGLASAEAPPDLLARHDVAGLSLWQWLSGPSVAMCTIISLVIWTTAGTFMLMFIAGLQDLPRELEEAAMLDGVNARQRLRYVVLPHLRPILFLVVTLGLIGTWQVFDQIYVMGKGAPAKTTLTPAYLSYDAGFGNFKYGLGAAMSFVLFAIIIAMTMLQRYVTRDKDAAQERRAGRAARRTLRSNTTVNR